MTDMWSIVFGLAVLLAIAILLQPVSKILRLPHTVLLALFGVGLAFLVQALGIDAGLPDGSHGGHAGHGETGHSDNSPSNGHGNEQGDGHGTGVHHEIANGALGWLEATYRQMLGALVSLNITSDVILFVFLPALVFESALSLDLRKLQKDLSAILFLAIVGVLASAVLVGFAMNAYAGVGLIVCILIGAIVSATDPVAVIALFKDLGAPKRLTILVEGESLFNDATAIVVATIFLGLLANTTESDLGPAILNFLRVFFGGVVVGVLIARGIMFLMKPFRNHGISVISLSLGMPFIAFVVAEHFLHVSGVMASVVCGLALGSHGRKIIPPQIFEEMEHSWHQLAFWATALIFILVGISVPTLLGDHFFEYLDDAVVLFLVATAVRALLIFTFVPALSKLKLIDRVSRSFQAIMWWGGLRGAVSLALALIVLNTPGIPEETTYFIGVLITVFVFATLLLQAPTISPLMAVLGLNKLSSFDETLRQRSLAWARRSVHDELEDLAEAQGSDPSTFDDILSEYEESGTSLNQQQSADTLETADWVRAGLNLALTQERQYYLEAYGDGAISGTRLRELLSRVEETVEAVRTAEVSSEEDFTPFKAALRLSYRHSEGFERAQAAQRRFGWVNPLADRLTTRFSILSAGLAALRRQEKEGYEDICALLPPKASEAFQELYSFRRAQVQRAHKALWLQYPDFAAAIDRRNIARTGFRLEAQAYDRLKENGLIGPEVYGDLTKGLDQREGNTRLPKLTLDYDPLVLVANVPFFQLLSPGERRKVASKLRTIFVAPEEAIISEGDPGDSMYFIANGAVDVHVAGDVVAQLGSGEFFGEMALVTGEPRSADVISEGYSTLLRLSKRDTETLMQKIPRLGAEIRKVATQRQRSNT